LAKSQFGPRIFPQAKLVPRLLILDSVTSSNPFCHPHRQFRGDESYEKTNMPRFLPSRPPPLAWALAETPPHPRTGRQDRDVPSQPRRRLKLAVRTLPLQPSASPRRGPSARSTAPALPVPIRLRLFPSAQKLLQIASTCSHPPKSCSRSPCSHPPEGGKHIAIHFNSWMLCSVFLFC